MPVSSAYDNIRLRSPQFSLVGCRVHFEFCLVFASDSRAIDFEFTESIDLAKIIKALGINFPAVLYDQLLQLLMLRQTLDRLVRDLSMLESD